MGGTSEREFLEKIVNIKTKSSKKAAEVKNDFAKMQKLKADALKKTEEMMQSAEHDIEKLEQEIMKSKDLVSESRTRLSLETKTTKENIVQKYNDLKKRVLAAIVPE